MTLFDFNRVIDENSAAWLADTAALCRVLDWRGFTTDETIHVVDAATLPADARRHAVAWTAPGLDRLLATSLRRDRRGGPVVVLDAKAIVSARHSADKVSERELKKLGRVECQQVGIHEFAHARVQESAGESLPESATWPLVLSAVACPQEQSRHDASHGLRWLRCYLHLSHRATEFWPWKWWLDEGLSADVEAHGLGTGREFAEALQAELAASADERLIDVLRRDPPAAFTELFESRVALRQAARLSA